MRILKTMGRLIKYLLFGALGLVTLLGIVAVLALILIDPNDYRDDIERAVKEETGRDLEIAGDLKLGIFPWLSIDIGATMLGNRPGFGDEPMVKLENASLALKLLPLLTGNVEVGKIEIDGAVIRLAVNANGENNWDDIAQAGEAEPAEVDIEVRDGDMGSLSVAGIALTNSAVYYIDRQAGADYTLENLRLQSGAITPGELVPIDAGFSFRSESAEMSGTATLSAGIMLDTGAGISRLQNLSFESDIVGFGDATLPLRLSANTLSLDTGRDSFEVDQLTGALAGMKFSTSLTGSGVESELAASGPFRIERFSPKSLMRDFGIEAPETARADALTRAELDATLNLKGESLRLDGVTLRLDETTLRGTLGSSGFETPAYAFDLSGDRINLDDYVAPATDEAASASAASLDETEIPAETIQTLNAKGSVKIGQATLAGLVFDDLVLGLDAGGKRLRLNPLTAKLFDGSYSGDIRIDASGAKPKLSLNEAVNDVQLGPLAKAMFDTGKLSGTIGGLFALSGTGSTLGEIRQTLTGKIQFALADGALEGRDIWYQIRRARALFKKQAPPAAPAKPRTEFSEVFASGTVANGIVTNDDFRAALPFLQLSGEGTVDLARDVIDYALSARVLERPDSLPGASAAELDEYTEAVIPIKITGSLGDPSIAPDFAALAKAKVQSKVDEKKEELKGKLLDKLGLGTKEEPDSAPAESQQLTDGEQPAEEPTQSPEEALKEKAREKLEKLFGD